LTERLQGQNEKRVTLVAAIAIARAN
jgi:hypothetical protein